MELVVLTEEVCLFLGDFVVSGCEYIVVGVECPLSFSDVHLLITEDMPEEQVEAVRLLNPGSNWHASFFLRIVSRPFVCMHTLLDKEL